MSCKVQVVIITRHPLEQGFGLPLSDNYSSGPREKLLQYREFRRPHWAGAKRMEPFASNFLPLLLPGDPVTNATADGR
jgi:hypothetical protein